MAALDGYRPHQDAPDAAPSLAPLQLGVGIPGGAQNIGHAINAALRSDSADTVVLSHDWPNAFNTIHWADLIAAVTSRHPSLIPFANLTYGSHLSVRFFFDTESATVDIACAHAVRQADHLGTLYFAMVLQHPLRPSLSRTLPCT
jgi:hypothetical protein